MQVPMVFNHLDIVVTVHETELSKHTGTYEDGGSTALINIADQEFNVTIP